MLQKKEEKAPLVWHTMEVVYKSDFGEPFGYDKEVILFWTPEDYSNEQITERAIQIAKADGLKEGEGVPRKLIRINDITNGNTYRLEDPEVVNLQLFQDKECLIPVIDAGPYYEDEAE